MTPPDTMAVLLGAAVRVGSVRLGEVVGVFLDEARARAIGFEVAGAGGVHRFLPWVAVQFGIDGVNVESALLLVDDGAAYERLGARPVRDESSLRGLRAGPDGLVEPRRRLVSPGPETGIKRPVKDDPVSASSAYAPRVDRVSPPAMLPRVR